MKSLPNLKIENELKNQLQEGELNVVNAEQGAVSQLLPLYHIPTQAEIDPIQKETEIIDQFVQNVDKSE